MKRIKKQFFVMIALLGLGVLQIAMSDKNRNVENTPRQPSLTQFEGFYRFPNRAAYIHFEVVDNALQAKQVWDGRQYALRRTGDLTFESKEEQYKVAFNTATPTTANILERVDLTKVDFDPTQRKMVATARMDLYKGTYHLERDKEQRIEVTSEGENLALIQVWDGKRITLDCITDAEFINEEGAMPVTFYIEEGKPIVMQCFEYDRWVKES